MKHAQRFTSAGLLIIGLLTPRTAQAQVASDEGAPASPAARIATEIGVTIAASTATLAAGYGITYGWRQTCSEGWEGIGCGVGSGTVGGAMTVGVLVGGVPALTDVAGNRQGKYWAGVVGSAVGTAIGVTGAAGVNVYLNDQGASDGAVLVGTVATLLVSQVAGAVLGYELSVDSSTSEPAAPTLARFVLVPNASSYGVGLTFLGLY